MKNEVILITGQRGQGKTTFIKNQIGVYSRVILFDLLGEFTYYETAYNLREFFEKLSAVKDENFFNLNYFNPKTSEEDFHVVCEAINRLNDIMFVVDEIDYFCTTHAVPKQFDEIVKRGRHQGLNLIVATRRPHEIPIIIRSQMTSLITFRQIERNDLQYLKEIIDLPEEDISGLEKFNYIKWTPEEGVTRGKVEKPKRNPKGNFEETKLENHNV